MDSLNLSPINDDNIHNQDNSGIQSDDLNSNQLPQSLGGTPYRSQDSIKYQQNNLTPSRELAEIKEKLTNSPGLDGLARKCNALKVQSNIKAAVTSQFYQQHVDHSLDIRQQLLATNHLLPQGFHKVQDQQIQSIFGEFKTPCKDQSKQESNQDIDDKDQDEPQNNNQVSTSGNKEKSLSAPFDARLILSQKIVSPLSQQQPVKETKEQEEGENKQVGEQNDQLQHQQFTNQIFGQSMKAQDMPFDSKFQRMLQSSSPIDQYKSMHNGNTGNAFNQIQMGYTNLKWDVQQQQQQYKPKKDLKNNFQSYLSMIGLGSNRNNHHGSNLQNSGNQLYFANKAQTGVSSGLQSLYRVSSTERSSIRNVPQIAIPFNNNITNLNNGSLNQGNKRRTGLEGIIDKINTKKDSLFQKKSTSGGVQNQNSLLTVSQYQKNQGSALSSSSNTNNLIKLSRMYPNTHLSSKQAELEGSLEKIRLISMQRNINYTPNISKENDQQQKLTGLLKSGLQSQQQQAQPLASTTQSLRTTSNQGANYFPQLASSIGVGQKYSHNSNSNQFFQGEKFQSKALNTNIQSSQNKQQLLSQPIQSFNPSMNQAQQQEMSTPEKTKNIYRVEPELQQELQQQREDIPQQDIPVEQNEQELNYDAFEDYDEKVNAITQESDLANLNVISDMN